MVALELGRFAKKTEIEIWPVVGSVEYRKNFDIRNARFERYVGIHTTLGKMTWVRNLARVEKRVNSGRAK